MQNFADSSPRRCSYVVKSFQTVLELGHFARIQAVQVSVIQSKDRKIRALTLATNPTHGW